MKNRDDQFAEKEGQTLVEGLDFYFENGLIVLTGRYLSARGYCCGNNCRHCPYDEIQQGASQ